MFKDRKSRFELNNTSNACRLPIRSYTAYAIQPYKPSKDVYKPRPDKYTFVCILEIVLLVLIVLVSGGLLSVIYNGMLLLVMLVGLLFFSVLRSSSLRRR